MPIQALTPADLRLSVDPSSLGFADTAELQHLPLPWIGQARAEEAARFGMEMAQPDYNLFVLGEVGSGRTTLLGQMMRAQSAPRAWCRQTFAICTTLTKPSTPGLCACRQGKGGSCAS